MRSNGKGIFEQDVESMSYCEIGKFRYDYRVQLKNDEEVKLKRSFGKRLLAITSNCDKTQVSDRA